MVVENTSILVYLRGLHGRITYGLLPEPSGMRKVEAGHIRSASLEPVTPIIPAARAGLRSRAMAA